MGSQRTASGNRYRLFHFTFILFLMVALVGCGGDDNGAITGPGAGNGNGNGGGNGSDADEVSFSEQQGMPFSVVELSLEEVDLDLDGESYEGVVGELDLVAFNTGDGFLVFIVPDLEEGTHEGVIDTGSLILRFDLEVLAGEVVEDADRYVEEYVEEFSSDTSDPELEEALQEMEELDEEERQVAAQFLAGNRDLFEEIDELLAGYGLASAATGPALMSLAEESCDRWCLLDRGHRLVGLTSKITRKIYRVRSRTGLRRGVEVAAKVITVRSRSYLPSVEPVVGEILETAYWPPIESAGLEETDRPDEWTLQLAAEETAFDIPVLAPGEPYRILPSQIPYRALTAADAQSPNEAIAAFVTSYERYRVDVEELFDHEPPAYNEEVSWLPLSDPDRLSLAVDGEEVILELETEELEEGQIEYEAVFTHSSGNGPADFDLLVGYSYEEYLFEGTVEMELAVQEDDEPGNGDDDGNGNDNDNQEPFGNWTEQVTGFSETNGVYLLGVDFRDEQHGWAVGYETDDGSLLGGVALYTENGGQSWTQQSQLDELHGSRGAPEGVLPVLEEVTYFDWDVTGQALALGHQGEIFRTTGFSDEWSIVDEWYTSERQRLEGADGLSGVFDTEIPMRFRSIQWDETANHTHWWVAGAAIITENDQQKTRPMILYSTSRGHTWNLQLDPTDTQMEGSLTSIDFVDEHTGWAVGQQGVILRTVNGGEDWEVLVASNNTQPDLFSVDFIDSTTGWAVGAGGLIKHTTDGGITWSVQREWSSGEARLNSVQFTDERNGWAVGHEGMILQTIDGGSNWVSQDVSGQMDPLPMFYSAIFPNSTTGWVVGAHYGGIIFNYSAE